MKQRVVSSRWQGLDKSLAALQLLSFVAAGAYVVGALLLYRYRTVDALTPMWEYLSSVHLVAPPLLILLFSYAYALISGAAVAEAPKNFWKWIRNGPLQEKRVMVGWCIGALLFAYAVAHHVQSAVPPVYGRLVAQLLGGANDDHSVIEEQLKQLKQKNPVLIQHIESARQIFEERRKWNHENKAPNATLPRIFIRAIDANLDDNDAWRSHPLRSLAAAEAHSMLAQALASSGSTAAVLAMRSARDRAIELYRAVINDPDSSSVTPLMRSSAELNIGNVYYYAGEFEHALETYKKIKMADMTAGVAGNAVAAQVLTHKVKDAVDYGMKMAELLQKSGRVQTEIRDYVSLVSNTGFAKLILEDRTARDNMQEAYDLLPDAMSKQNLALAHLVDGQPQLALAVLEDDAGAPLVSSSSEMEVVAKTGGGSCTYLIRAMAIEAAKGAPVDAAANFAGYVRRAVSQIDLAREPGRWRTAAKDGLAKDGRPCGGLALVPLVSRTLAQP